MWDKDVSVNRSLVLEAGFCALCGLKFSIFVVSQYAFADSCILFCCVLLIFPNATTIQGKCNLNQHDYSFGLVFGSLLRLHLSLALSLFSGEVFVV